LIKAENYHGNQLVDHNLAQTYHCQEAHWLYGGLD
jgi:hypothetical protein